MQPSDESLVQWVRQGDEKAFVELLGRYEYPIAQLIRYTITNTEDAEDVLQETLLDAWTGFKYLRDPDNARAWLMQIARNRCADYFRSRQHREVPIESSEIESRLDAVAPFSRQLDIVRETLGALDQAPEAEREVAKLFYLKGYTIAEIAERHSRPEGTVKRQLFMAREFVRQALGITPPERIGSMGTHRVGSKTQPFPRTLPEIEVTPLDIEPFVIDCREMRYWGIIPEIGQRTLSADYDADGILKRVWDLRAVRPAKVHNVDGVEIELEEWWWEDGWRPITVYCCGRLLDDKAEWLAQMIRTGEQTNLRTFLDEGFVWAYPSDKMKRYVSDGDLFDIQADGSLKTTQAHEDYTESGCGYFTVRIGNRVFACLRILFLEGPLADENTAVDEIYISDTGRMVLERHYCHPDCSLPLDETVNENLSIVVDGRKFLHFRDTLTDTGCGIKLA